MKDSILKPVPNSTACRIQTSFPRAVFRLDRKLTMATLIRVLLCVAVFSTFLGNIIFLLETRKMNSEGEKHFNDQEYPRQSFLQEGEAVGNNVEKLTSPSKCCNLLKF